MSRWSRQIGLADIGDKGQQRIRDATMVLVGLGGLGCPAAQYLAAAGVGHLVLCDHDEVDEANLSRQILYRDHDLGRPKVDCASRELKQLNPELRVTSLQRRLQADDLAPLVADASVVVDASDNFATRLAVNQACLNGSRPWVMGAAVRFEGQLMVFRPDRSPSPCYRCIYGDASTSLDDCHGAGVFSPLTGIIGTAMAAESLRIVLDLQDEQTLSLFDGRRFQWRQLAVQPDPDCPVCGHDHG